MATPEELRAAADAFASVGKPRDIGDVLKTTLDEALADASALVHATLSGDTAEADRLKAKMGVNDLDDEDDEDEEEDDDDEL